MMENMIISSRKSKKIQMVMMMCKKHPKHRQSPGVCSICLRKKLTKLLPSTSSSRATTITNASTCSSSSSLSSLSSECSSNASSNNSSPMHHQHSYRGQRRQEVGLEGKAGHLLSFLKMMRIKNDNKINVLTKSRSMAFVEERERRISMDGIVKENNKKGFWSKLIRSKSSNKRRMKAEGGLLMHSKTMRDMLTTR